MAQQSQQQVETGHLDTIHDAQLDFYGRRLATCSSDRTIKIFDVAGDSNALVAELKGHEGPVWQVCWSHPKYQSVLASCSYDRTVAVWRETQHNQWQECHRHAVHDASVNSVVWAPHDYGLWLCCASSDGTISVVHMRQDASAESQQRFSAHPAGVNAVSWSPPVAVFGSNAAGGAAGGNVGGGVGGAGGAVPRRFVSGGCDNLVCVWRLSDMNEWRKECTLQGHTDWVRDVAWAPSVGGTAGTVASASQDRTVIVWREEAPQQWRKSVIQFDSVPWRVSWSVTGNILAVSCDDNTVSLFKEGLGGDWAKISQETNA